MENRQKLKIVINRKIFIMDDLYFKQTNSDENKGKGRTIRKTKGSKSQNKILTERKINGLELEREEEEAVNSRTKFF